MPDPFDPAAALDLTLRTRANLADHSVARWYAPLYGLNCGIAIAAHSLAQPWATTVTIVAVLALVTQYRYWTDTSGLQVSATRAGSTLPTTLVYLAVFFVIGGGALALRYDRDIIWAPLVAGVVLVPVAAYASARWDRIWRDEMRRL